MQPHVAELAHYRIEEMVPLDDLWVHDVDIDWKNLVENYVEDYHFPMGHPGLSALMESQYDREVLSGRHDAPESPHAREAAQDLERASATPSSCRRWSICPRTCAAAGRTSGCSRTCIFDIYPEWLDFFQLVPARARAHAHSRALLWISGRPPRDEGGALAVHAAQRAGAGGRRGADALRAAGPRHPAPTREAFFRTRKSCSRASRTGSARGCRSRSWSSAGARRGRGAKRAMPRRRSGRQIARRYHS